MYMVIKDLERSLREAREGRADLSEELQSKVIIIVVSIMIMIISIISITIVNTFSSSSSSSSNIIIITNIIVTCYIIIIIIIIFMIVSIIVFEELARAAPRLERLEADQASASYANIHHHVGSCTYTHM